MEGNWFMVEAVLREHSLDEIVPPGRKRVYYSNITKSLRDPHYELILTLGNGTMDIFFDHFFVKPPFENKYESNYTIMGCRNHEVLTSHFNVGVSFTTDFGAPGGIIVDRPYYDIRPSTDIHNIVLIKFFTSNQYSFNRDIYLCLGKKFEFKRRLFSRFKFPRYMYVFIKFGHKNYHALEIKVLNSDSMLYNIDIDESTFNKADFKGTFFAENLIGNFSFLNECFFNFFNKRFYEFLITQRFRTLTLYEKHM